MHIDVINTRQSVGYEGRPFKGNCENFRVGILSIKGRAKGKVPIAPPILAPRPKSARSRVCAGEVGAKSGTK
jgi:hypothetical protein